MQIDSATNGMKSLSGFSKRDGFRNVKKLGRVGGGGHRHGAEVDTFCNLHAGSQILSPLHDLRYLAVMLFSGLYLDHSVEL